MTVGFTVFLMVVSSLIVIYIYTLLQIVRWEEEFTLPSKEDQLRSKMTKARTKENVAWLFLALGAIMDIIGFFQPSFQNSLFLIILGGCIVIVSFFTATYYKKERSKCMQQLEKMRPSPSQT